MLFQTTMFQDPSKFVMNLNFVIATVAEIFMLMTFANDLSSESDVLRERIYFSDWICLGTQSKKDFRLLHLGMQKSFGIKCYNWLNLNNSTFTTVVEISYKWFTMMSNVK